MSKKRLPPPVYLSDTGRYVLWWAVARDAMARPGVWFLALPAVSASKENDVRRRRHPDLVLPRGRLEAQARNRYTHEGRRMADLYIRYMED